MKLRSAPLDEVWQTLQFTLDDDGRQPALAVRHMVTWAYRGLRGAMLALLRLPWRRGALDDGCRPRTAA
jgi:hypothetical protein